MASQGVARPVTSQRRPRERGDPYAAAAHFLAQWRTLALQQTPVDMAPVFAGTTVHRGSIFQNSRVMRRYSFAISRPDMPEVCRKFPCPPIRGRRECRAPDAPDSRVCNEWGGAHTR